MDHWRNSRAPVFFLIGLSLGIWGCAPEGDFGPASSQDGANLGAGVDANYVPSSAEHEVHELVNDYRNGAGLSDLDLDDLVSSVARAHSDDMAEGLVAVGHDGFDTRAQDVIDALGNATSVGENVGRVSGAETEAEAAEAMLEYWIESPDHLENMLDEGWDLAGSGVAQGTDGTWFYTQVFVGVR